MEIGRITAKVKNMIIENLYIMTKSGRKQLFQPLFYFTILSGLLKAVQLIEEVNIENMRVNPTLASSVLCVRSDRSLRDIWTV